MAIIFGQNTVLRTAVRIVFALRGRHRLPRFTGRSGPETIELRPAARQEPCSASWGRLFAMPPVRPGISGWVGSLLVSNGNSALFRASGKRLFRLSRRLYTRPCNRASWRGRSRRDGRASRQIRRDAFELARVLSVHYRRTSEAKDPDLYRRPLRYEPHRKRLSAAEMPGSTAEPASRAGIASSIVVHDL